MKLKISLLFLSSLFIGLTNTYGQAYTKEDSVFIRQLFETALSDGKSYEWLRHLSKNIGPRLSGSEGAAKGVTYTAQVMKDEKFDRVYLQDVMVPHWVRGKKEKAYVTRNGKKIPVSILALGGSISTPKKGIKAPVIEVHSFQELRSLGAEKIKGKIVFFNRPLDPKQIDTFQGYAGAVEQRANGAMEAGKLGAVAAIVRSVTTKHDDHPHTGSMRYAPGAPLIPTAAISLVGADILSDAIKNDSNATFYFEQHCETLPDAPSHNVIGEVKGNERPNEYLVVGGHLDSWDVGEGAQDDGAGCVQSIEAIRLLKVLGYQPRHSLRAVMFMNEENGLKGGIAYADSAKKLNEKHIAAIESDRGGLRPTGFGIVGNDAQKARIKAWQPLFSEYGLHELGKGGGGADIGPLGPSGTVLLGLVPDTNRYFDHHHAPSDTFESINRRELELGAASMAAMLYLIDKYGITE